jgi:hypothetical protein
MSGSGDGGRCERWAITPDDLGQARQNMSLIKRAVMQRYPLEEKAMRANVQAMLEILATANPDPSAPDVGPGRYAFPTTYRIRAARTLHEMAKYNAAVEQGKGPTDGDSRHDIILQVEQHRRMEVVDAAHSVA